MCTNKKNVTYSAVRSMVCHYLAYFWMNILKFIDRFGSVQTARFLIICKFTNRRFSVSEIYLQELLLLFSKYTIGFVCRRNLQTKSSLIGLEMYKEQVLWLLRKFTDNKFPDCLENLHKAVIVPEMFSLSLYSRVLQTSTFLVLDNSQTTVCSCSRNLQSTSSLAGLNFYS